MKKILIGMIVLFIVLPILTSAATYYVSTTGSDTSSGTQAAPWKTIQKAANTMVAGETAIVQAGDYSSERVSVTKSGSSGAPITYQASGIVIMKGFKIIANYVTVKDFEIANTDYVRWQPSIGSGVYIKGNNVVIDSNYIHDSSLNGITLYGSPDTNSTTITHDCIMRNNKVYRNEMVGIEVHGRNNLIEGNEVWNTLQCHPALVAVEGPGCPGYSAVGSLDADGMRFFGAGDIFRNNYIHDIKYDGSLVVNAHIDCWQTWAGTYNEVASNIIFEQNFCDNLQSQASNENGHGFMLAGGANNIYIKNNIIRAYGGINTGGTGNANYLYIYNNLWINNLAFTQFYPMAVGLENVPNAVVKNNIFYNQPYHTIYSSGTVTSQDIDYNLAYNSDGSTPDCFRVVSFSCKSPAPVHDLWKVDPKFVNPNAGDYHLSAGSPAIDAGVVISSVTNDYAGSSRPQGAGYDIGAFEYGAATPPDCTEADWMHTDGLCQPNNTLVRTWTKINSNCQGGVSHPASEIVSCTYIPPNVPGDLTGDGKVDVQDLIIVASDFGKTTNLNNPKSDTNSDGIVDIFDVVYIASRFT